MSDTQSERLHALDAVRGFALLAGVAFHATLSFLPGPPVWIVMDSQRSVALSVTFFLLHMFRMTVFFLIAGFFAHLSFHRRGLGGFIADRARRIALPLVVGWPIVISAITACVIWSVMKTYHGHPPPGPAPAFPTLPAFPLTHLWFLWVLLLLYAGALILRAPFALIDRSGALRRGADRVIAFAAGNPIAPVLLAAPLAAAFALQPDWLMWFGIMTPDSNLIPNPSAIVGFSLAFGVGWMIHRQPELLQVWRRRWALNLALAVLATLATLAIVGPTPVLAPEPDQNRRLLGAAAYALSSWAWTTGLIGAALRFLHKESPARRYVADASYWIYLIHIPIIMALQVLVSDLAWPWFVKYPLILAVAFALMFASYQLIVRHSVIGGVLNGRRHPKRRRGHAGLEPDALAP
jgi:glucan biosynthesis protein C